MAVMLNPQGSKVIAEIAAVGPQHHESCFLMSLDIEDAWDPSWQLRVTPGEGWFKKGQLKT